MRIRHALALSPLLRFAIELWESAPDWALAAAAEIPITARILPLQRIKAREQAITTSLKPPSPDGFPQYHPYNSQPSGVNNILRRAWKSRTLPDTPTVEITPLRRPKQMLQPRNRRAPILVIRRRHIGTIHAVFEPCWHVEPPGRRVRRVEGQKYRRTVPDPEFHLPPTTRDVLAGRRASISFERSF